MLAKNGVLSIINFYARACAQASGRKLAVFKHLLRARISLKAYFVKRNIVQMFSRIVVVQARLLEREEKTEGQQTVVA